MYEAAFLQSLGGTQLLTTFTYSKDFLIFDSVRGCRSAFYIIGYSIYFQLKHRSKYLCGLLPYTHIPLDGVFATLMAITEFLYNYSKSQQKRRQSYDLGTSRFLYASTTLLLRFCYAAAALLTIRLRCHCASITIPLRQ